MRWLLVGVVVATTVIGDVLQSHEMKVAAREQGEVKGVAALLRVIATRRYMILAILSMAVSFFAFLTLIQTEPISFAVPASAATFVLETIFAGLVLKERIGARRMGGAVLVFCGIILLAY